SRTASSLPGSGTSTLVFRYTVQPGDNDTDGIAAISPIALNGGTIKDAAGNDAAVTFTAPDTSAVLVDTTPPTAALTYSPLSAAKSGSLVTVTATFNEPMADAPVPTIAISAVPGGTALAATPMTKVDSTHYTYLYTVQAGVDGNATVTMGAGKDVAGNLLTATPTSGAIFGVDNTPPTAALTYAPAGMVKQGTTLTLTATFNEDMADAPAPQFSVSGANTAAATPMTKVDATHYTASYVVGAGDGTATVALSTGTDVAGNEIIGAPTSGSTFIVDSTPPTVSIGAPSATVVTSGPVTYTVTYADANFNASTLAAGDITLTTTGTATAPVAVTGTGTTRTVTLSNTTGDGPLGISIAAGTATDLAGNTAPAATSATFTVAN